MKTTQHAWGTTEAFDHPREKRESLDDRIRVIHQGMQQCEEVFRTLGQRVTEGGVSLSEQAIDTWAEAARREAKREGGFGAFLNLVLKQATLTTEKGRVIANMQKQALIYAGLEDRLREIS